MQIIKRLCNSFREDSLYENSIYLMLNTFIMSGFGFVFWMICARLFTTRDVGLATTLISVMGLITSFSMLGLNTGIIRYLPTSERKNEKINTCFTISVLVTIIISTVFLLELKIFSPQLLFIKENLFLSFSFIFFMVFSTSNVLLESVFIAFRSAKFILIKNAIFSILKLAFPFLFITLGAYGIFSSWMAALMIGCGASFIILIRKFNYKPNLVFYDSIIKKIGRFSFGNYVAGFLAGAPQLILPLIITNMVNPEMAAYFYIDIMIAGLLFIIPQAVSQSLFAESSANENVLKEYIKKAVKIIALILIPAIIVVMIFGKHMLLLFGKEYSTEGFELLQLLALSSIFIAINSIFGTILKVREKIKELVFVCFIGALSISGLSYLFISKGLLGIGIAWIIGEGIISLIYLFVIKLRS